MKSIKVYSLVLAYVLFLLCGHEAYSQGGWKKKYYLQNSQTSYCSNVIEATNGNFIAIGITTDTLNNQSFNRLTLIGIDPTGNILWRKNYGDSKFQYLNVMSGKTTVKESGNFYQTLCARDSTNKYWSIFLKFNYNGDTVWQKKFSSNLPGVDMSFEGLGKSVDSGFLITGIFEDFNLPQEQCLALKTDHNGNELWRRQINKTGLPNVNQGSAILQDSTTKKIVITGYQYIGTATNANTYSNILILDSLGNNPIRKTFNNAEGGGFGEIIQLKDKNFLTGGANCINYNKFIFKSLLVKFDINGGIIWSKEFDESGYFNTISRIYELPNEDIVVIGSTDTAIFVKKLEYIRLDKNGNLKLKKYIGSAHFVAQNNFYSLETCISLNPTSNNGFVLSSWFQYLPSPHPFSIIKVDSTGCDTTEQWCQSVALGINNFNKLTGYNFEIFPNPANDVLNIQINAPADKSFIIKLNNLNGNELQAIESEPNALLQLNTANYSPGVYFISILYEGKAVEIRKLVIVN